MKSVTCDCCGEFITKTLRYSISVDRINVLVPYVGCQNQFDYDSFDLCEACYKRVTRMVNGRATKEEDEENKGTGEEILNQEGGPTF